MVTIVNLGTKPEERTYTAECGNCNTVFRFARAEAQLVYDQRDGDYLKIRCPHCQVRKVSVAVEAFDRIR